MDAAKYMHPTLGVSEWDSLADEFIPTAADKNSTAGHSGSYDVTAPSSYVEGYVGVPWKRPEAPGKPVKRQAVYQEMLKLYEKLEADVQLLENKIYDMEGNYLAATADVGNMIRGWDGYISSSGKTRRPAAKTTGMGSSNQDRLFSLTSTTSRASRELAAWTGVEDVDRHHGGGAGKCWNNGSASHVSNSINSTCSASVRCTKRASSRTGGPSSSAKTSSGRHSSGTAGHPPVGIVTAQKSTLGSVVGGKAPVDAGCHSRV